MKIYSPVFYMEAYSLAHDYRGFEGTCCRNVQEPAAVMFKTDED